MYYTLLLHLAHSVEDGRRPLFSLFSGVRQNLILSARRAAASRRTYMRGIGVRGCSTGVAVGKDKVIDLPSMRTTHAHVVGIAVGNLPPCRHGQSGQIPKAFNNFGAIIDFAKMQGHVQVGAVTLMGWG